MSIDQRGAESWRIRLAINGETHTRTIRGDRSAAERAELALKLQLLDGRPADPHATVGDIVARWFAGHRGTISGSVADDYERIIAKFLNTGPFPATPVADVTEGTVDGFYRHLVDTGLGAPRVRRVHTVLRQALRRAHRDGLISRNAAADADLPPIEPSEIVPPSPEEVLSLVEAAAATQPGLDVFLRLAAVTGARRGELCALRFSDFTETDITISRALATAKGHTTDGLESLEERTTKTRKIRRLALDAQTVDIVAGHYQALVGRAADAHLQLIDDPRVFTDDLCGRQPWRPETASRYWGRARKTAGLERIRLHDLRHYVASMMMATGIDVTTGMGRGGWSNPTQFLGRYAHFQPAPDRTAADTLGSLLDDQG